MISGSPIRVSVGEHKQISETVILRFPVGERGEARVSRLYRSVGVADVDETIRVGIRQRLQQHRVKHREDGGVGCDSERQRGDGDDGKTRCAHQ